MKYTKITYGEALVRWRDGNRVLAAINGDDPRRGVIELETPAEFGVFSDVLFVEEPRG